MTLKDLEIGESGRVSVVGGEGKLRRHFLDMGLVPGAVESNIIEQLAKDAGQ